MAIPSSIVERAKARSGGSSSGGRSGSSGSIPSSVVSRARARSGGQRNVVTGGTSSSSWARSGQRRSADAVKGVGPAFTPVRVVLDVASAPFYSVGNLLSGDPMEAVKNIVSAGQLGRKQFVSEAPIVARAIESIPGPDWLRTGAGITTDFATDPLTYISFGAGGVIRGAAGRAAREAERRAGRALQEAAEGAQARGRRLPTAREAAEAGIRHASALSQTPSTAKLYARLPLSRNRGFLIGESRTLARAGEAVRRGVGDTTLGGATRSALRADRGTDPRIFEGWRMARYWSNAIKRDVLKRIDDAEGELISTYGHREGRDLSEFTTRHLDQPDVYPISSPRQADAVERAKVVRTDIEEIAREAGIDMGFVENYVPHLPRTRKAAREFERRFGRRPEQEAYTRERTLRNLDQWEKLGLDPELNVWALLRARTEMGVRDAAQTGFKDAVAGLRGVRHAEMPEVSTLEQAGKVAEAEADLAGLSARADTAPAAAAVKQARAELKGAREALRVAETEPNRAAVARAERALARAQAQAQPEAIMGRPARSGEGTVGDVVSEGLETASRASRSRPPGARLAPEATAGRYAAPIDPSMSAPRLRRAANTAERKAADLWQQLWGSTRGKNIGPLQAAVRQHKAKLEGEQMRSPKSGPIVQGERFGLGAKGEFTHTTESNWYTFHPAVEGLRKPTGKRAYIAKKGKNKGKLVKRTSKRDTEEKTLADMAEDYMDRMRREVEQHGGPHGLDDADRAIWELLEEHDALVSQAMRYRTALGEANLDPLEGARAVRAMAEELPRSRINMRARRDRAALPAETPRAARNATDDLSGFSAEGKARFRDYFTGEGPIEETIRGAREVALEEVEAAQRATRGQVERARKRLGVAQTRKDEEAIAHARRQLKVAQRTERQVSQDLAVARQTWGGTPAEIAKGVRRVMAEQAELRRVESFAREVARSNARLRARPAARVAEHDEYRELLAEGWQKFTSKRHTGTLLDSETARAMRAVDDEVTRLVKDDVAVRALTGFMRQAGAAWKALALFSPRYHIRNLVDDGLTDYIAGARNPASYAEAAALKAGRNPKISTKLYGEVDGETLLAMAEVQGVMHQGFAAWDVARAQRAGQRRWVSWPGSGRGARASRFVGEVREDWSRVGLFIERLKAGDDWIKAGRTVRRYRYDYSDLSPFLMSARTVAVPFLTFTWKTIPLLAHIGATRPGVFSKTNIIVEWLNAEGGLPDRELFPPWARDSFGVPLPGAVASAFGGAPGEPMVLNPRMTFRYGNLDQLDPRPEALARNAGGLLGPLIGLPAAGILGYSTFRAREIRDEGGPIGAFTEGERARVPALIEGLESLGLPIPNYSSPDKLYRDKDGNLVPGGKRDAFTGESVPGYSARLHELLSGFPPFQQTGSFLPGGGVTDWQRALMRWGTGADISPERRERALFFAERYGRLGEED